MNRRSIIQNALSFVAPIAIVLFLLLNRHFIEDPYSWTYAGTIVSCGFLIVVIPYRSAFAADLMSTILLVLTQIELAYVAEWSGLEYTYGTLLLKVAIPVTSLFAIIILTARLTQAIALASERTVWAEDQYWSQRLGALVGTVVTWLLVTALAGSVYLDMPVVSVLDDTVLLTLAMFMAFMAIAFATSAVVRVALERRWEQRGYRVSIERLQAFPEYIVREVVKQEAGLTDLQSLIAALAYGLFIVTALVVRLLLGFDAAVIALMAGMVLAVGGSIIVALRLSKRYKEAWYEKVRLRIGDSAAFREASAATSLGWPNEDIKQG